MKNLSVFVSICRMRELVHNTNCNFNNKTLLTECLDVKCYTHLGQKQCLNEFCSQNAIICKFCLFLSTLMLNLCIKLHMFGGIVLHKVNKIGFHIKSCLKTSFYMLKINDFICITLAKHVWWQLVTQKAASYQKLCYQLSYADTYQ